MDLHLLEVVLEDQPFPSLLHTDVLEKGQVFPAQTHIINQLLSFLMRMLHSIVLTEPIVRIEAAGGGRYHEFCAGFLRLLDCHFTGIGV